MRGSKKEGRRVNPRGYIKPLMGKKAGSFTKAIRSARRTEKYRGGRGSGKKEA